MHKSLSFPVVVMAALVANAAWTAADEVSAAKRVEPAQETPLESAVRALNELLLSGGPKAITCSIGNGGDVGITTAYYERPLERTNDGSYECVIKWHVITRRPNQQDQVQVYENIMRLITEGERVVSTTRFKSGGMTGIYDEALLGNGSRTTYRGAGSGDIESTEYFRMPDGPVRAIQRYKGLPTAVVYHEAPVPAELKRDGQRVKTSVQFSWFSFPRRLGR